MRDVNWARHTFRKWLCEGGCEVTSVHETPKASKESTLARGQDKANGDLACHEPSGGKSGRAEEAGAHQALHARGLSHKDYTDSGTS